MEKSLMIIGALVPVVLAIISLSYFVGEYQERLIDIDERIVEIERHLERHLDSK